MLKIDLDLVDLQLYIHSCSARGRGTPHQFPVGFVQYVRLEKKKTLRVEAIVRLRQVLKLSQQLTQRAVPVLPLPYHCW